MAYPTYTQWARIRSICSEIGIFFKNAWEYPLVVIFLHFPPFLTVFMLSNLGLFYYYKNQLELAKNCYILFRRQLQLLHSVLEHLFGPNEKHVNLFFQ